MPDNSGLKFNLKREPGAGLPPEGIHRFVVEAADPKPGGDKGPLLTLRLRLYVNGVKHNSAVFDNLPTSEESRWKVDQFFNCVGAPESGEAGPAWFVGKTGYVRVENGLNQQGDPRSNVKRYLTPDETEKAIEKRARQDDDAPVTPAARSKQQVSEPARKTAAKRPQVDELVSEESSPF